MKIDQLAFIGDLVNKKRFANCNANVIFMKAGLLIEIKDLEDYKETDLWIYL